VRQPLAAQSAMQKPREPTIVHRESAIRMASDPSLVPAILCQGDSVRLVSNV